MGFLLEGGMHLRAKKQQKCKLCHLRRLSGSPQVCFGQASGFACGMPSIQFLSGAVQNAKGPARAPAGGLC